jgi:hypothetical protein
VPAEAVMRRRRRALCLPTRRPILASFVPCVVFCFFFFFFFFFSVYPLPPHLCVLSACCSDHPSVVACNIVSTFLYFLVLLFHFFVCFSSDFSFFSWLVRQAQARCVE